MLKKITLFFIFCISITAKAQIPIIESNVTEGKKDNSLIYKTFHNKYDFLISFRSYSGWRIGDKTFITILALQNKRWKKIILSFPDSKPTSLTIKKTSFASTKVTQLLKDLALQNFWSLSDDSLNMMGIAPKIPLKNYVKNDTIVIVSAKSKIRVLDGSTYYFEILQGSALRYYRCEDPEIYLEYYPEIKSRAYFIKARDAFIAALKE